LDSFGNWYIEHLSSSQSIMLKVTEVLYSGKTRYQQVDIIQSEIYGRSLILDGKTQSTERDEFVYHEALVSPAMFLHQKPQDVFIAGGGEGATLREVLNHKSVSKVTMVDLDQEVIELSKLYLPNHHNGSFDDERLELHHCDARTYLNDNNYTYDVIILDLVDPLEEGIAYQLYTREFYEIVRSCLNRGGIMVTQSGSADITNFTECYAPIVNTIQSVFPDAKNYQVNVSGFGMPWSFTIASQEPVDTDIENLMNNIRERVHRDLKFYDHESHVHMFNVPKYVREQIQNESRINSDDDPIFMI